MIGRKSWTSSVVTTVVLGVGLALCSYFHFHKSNFIKIQYNIYLHYYEYSLLIEDFMQFELSIATLLRFPKVLIIIELHKFINTPHV
jgi:hypothetical protein